MRIRIDSKDSSELSREHLRRTVRFRLGSLTGALTDAQLLVSVRDDQQVHCRLTVRGSSLLAPLSEESTAYDVRTAVDAACTRLARKLSLRLEGQRRRA